MTARKRQLLVEVECGDTECGGCRWMCSYGPPREFRCGIHAHRRLVLAGRTDVPMRGPECLAAEQPEPKSRMSNRRAKPILEKWKKHCADAFDDAALLGNDTTHQTRSTVSVFGACPDCIVSALREAFGEGQKHRESEPEPKWSPVRDEAGKVVGGQHEHPLLGRVRRDDQGWWFDPPDGGEPQGDYGSMKRAKLRAKKHHEAQHG